MAQKCCLRAFFHAVNASLAEVSESGRGAKSAGFGETPRRGRAMRFAQQNALAVRRSRTAAPTDFVGRGARPRPRDFRRSAPKRGGKQYPSGGGVYRGGR